MLKVGVPRFTRVPQLLVYNLFLLIRICYSLSFFFLQTAIPVPVPAITARMMIHHHALPLSEGCSAGSAVGSGVATGVGVGLASMGLAGITFVSV